MDAGTVVNSVLTSLGALIYLASNNSVAELSPGEWTFSVIPQVTVVSVQLVSPSGSIITSTACYPPKGVSVSDWGELIRLAFTCISNSQLERKK